MKDYSLNFSRSKDLNNRIFFLSNDLNDGYYLFRSKDLFTFISSIPNMKGKAYVTFVLSSGMKQGEVLNLTIRDLVNACEYVFLNDEDKTLDILLTKNPNEIVPIWRIEKKNKKKVTFTSSESMYYLFNYLRERRLTNSLTLDDYLFDFGKKNNVSEQMSLIFKNFRNVQFNYENPISIKKIKHLYDGGNDGFFREEFSPIYVIEEIEDVDFNEVSISSETLREHFKKVCDLFLPSFVENKKDLRKYSLKKTHYIKHRKLCELFTDGLNEDEKYYKDFTSDLDQLKEYYLGIEKYLTTKEFDAIESVFLKSIEEREYSSSNLDKVPSKELDKYIDNYFTRLKIYSSLDKETADEIIKIFKFNIHRDNKHNQLINTESYFNMVLDDAMLEYEIKSDPYFDNFYISKKFIHSDVTKIVNYMDKKRLFNSYSVDKDLFKDLLITYVQKQVENDKSTRLSKRIILALSLEAKYRSESKPPKQIYIMKS